MEKIKTYSKKHYSQIVRHIIQIVCFFAMPALFVLSLNSIGGIYQLIISNSFTFESSKMYIFCLLAIIPLTFIFGRVFCGYMCAFGSMQEFINFLGKKMKIKQIDIPQKWEKGLKYVKYAVLALFVISWIFKLTIDPYNPWYVFGVYSNIKGWSNLLTFLSVGGALLFLIIVSSLFSERIFCRFLCPLGGLLALISKLRIFKIKSVNKGCVGCKQCNKQCPMKIDIVEELKEHDKITSGECINCLKCVDVCPKKAIDNRPSETIKYAAAAVAISGIYFAGVISSSVDSGTQNIVIKQPEQKIYIDGVYQGTGEGFRGPIKVTVTVDDGLIKIVVVNSFQDDPEFFNRAKSSIINEVISNQKTDVSIVSGATYSSNGLISAIKNALEPAKLEIVATPTGSNSSQSGTSQEASSSVVESIISSQSSAKESSSKFTENSSINQPTSNWADGSYSGTGRGFRGNTTLTVTITNGRITSIVINSYVDDEKFFSRAKDTMISRIIQAQSTNVQTVSGATYSSRGIISAVNDALSKA